MFKGAPAAPPSLAMLFMFVHTWATLIHQQIYFPLVLGPLVLLLEDVRIDEMTRRDTALNWSTVAFTVGALPSFFFLPHTQPRQCQATTFLNSFCLTEKSATIKNQFCNDIAWLYRQFTLWDWSIWRCFCRMSCLCNFWGCPSGSKKFLNGDRTQCSVKEIFAQSNLVSGQSKYWEKS